MVKKKMVLRPARWLSGNEAVFVVSELVNTTSPRIGEEVSESEVKKLIRTPGWTVVIKEGRD